MNVPIVNRKPPSASEMRRPKRSAIAPVGTSAMNIVNQKTASISPTCVSERPRSSWRKMIQTGTQIRNPVANWNR